MTQSQLKSVAVAPAGYQLGIVQEILLALLAVEPARASQLGGRLRLALGPLADALNEGQIYVTLARLEKAGMVGPEVDHGTRERKVYALRDAGAKRVRDWLADTSWSKPAPAEFHLKLVAAAAAGWADPVSLVDAQRHELLAGLREAQRAGMNEPEGSTAALLLEGVVLRLQGDLRWLEQCARYWNEKRSR